jgi:CheY-like chemotaxis protein
MPIIVAKKSFGCSVKACRKQLGISQEELAERADLHRTYVSDVERGTRNLSLQSIGRLARALETSVASLFPQSELPRERPVTGSGHGEDLVDILLVENNDNDVELTLQAFKNARFTNRIHVLSDGEEALDYFFDENTAARPATDHPHIILLDLKLPKVSGLEVLRRLKADRQTRMIPVVILTVSEDNCDIAECRRLGAENYIVKPVDFQTLIQATPQLNLNWALFRPPQTIVRNIHG